LAAMLKNDREPEIREAALRALAAINYENMGQAIEQALSDREKSVRVVGLDLVGSMDIQKDLTVTLLSDVIESKTTEEKQAALVTLGTLPIDNTKPVFDRLLDRMDKGNLPAEIHLELTEAVKASNSEPLIAKIDEIRSRLSPETLDEAFYDAMYGGDPERGSGIVFRHQTAQCMRCHSYNDYGGNAGPRLNAIGAKLSRQELLEALIDPGKRLAPGYGFVTIALKDGKTFSGIIQEENDVSLALKIGSRADTVIRQDDIDKKTYAPSSMPDMKNFLTKREIRDLVSFLATLKEDEMMSRQSEEGHGE
jgi:quinoprotein glucose dehydrogenase